LSPKQQSDPIYSRVVVKLSGAALAGREPVGLEAAALEHVAAEILSVVELGVQVGVVVGGGNFFRGALAERWGIERAEADSVGILGTVMNGLMLRGVLTARTHTEVRVMTALPIPAVAEPFIRLRAQAHLQKGHIVILAGGIGQPYVTTDYPSVQRALELDANALLVAKHGVDGVYSSDPQADPSAVRYEELSFSDAIARDLRVMDPSAFILARDHGLPLHVFDVERAGAMADILRGEPLGTRISSNVVPVADERHPREQSPRQP
jgi:uridylate kinase